MDKSGERREAYRLYLKSFWWRERRRKYLQKHPACEKCSSTTLLQIHHRVYTRGGISILYNEQDSELQTLCDNCHREHHFGKKGEKKKKLSKRDKKRLKAFQRAKEQYDKKRKKGKKKKDYPVQHGPIWADRTDPPARLRVKLSSAGLTHEQVDAVRTPKGGWTRRQLEEWGVEWPPKKGWRRELENRALPANIAIAPSELDQQFEDAMKRDTQ